ncbi:MAG: sensor histidine kinase [Candidatus Eiseniibacteriota bacterium]
MKLRERVLLGTTLLVLLPLAALCLAIRQEMAARLVRQDARRVDALVAVIEGDLKTLDRDLGLRAAALAESFRDDDRVRAALAAGRRDAPEVLDWTPRAMALAGLDVLQVQDARGRIVSAGHFRNAFGVSDEGTPAELREQAGLALIRARRAEGTFPALARLDSLSIGAGRYTLIAGVEMHRARLQRLSPGGELGVSLVTPDGVVSSNADLEATLRESHATPPDRLARPLALPGGGPSHLLVTHSLATRRALLASLDRWLLAAWVLAAAGSVLFAVRLSAHVSRPIEELARKAATLELDRLPADFATARRDEIGTLSRFLAEMTARLRAGVIRVQEAERRATLGEIARQVNHDLANAFAPLRNVVTHLGQVGERSPAELPRVWAERRDTLESGLSYLERLAGNWRRLSTRPERAPTDLAAVVRQVSEARLREQGGPVTVTLPAAPALVLADAVGLRRIVENLVANACESLESDRGRVDVIVEPDVLGGSPALLLRVVDDGHGIPPADRERIFENFFTTKPDGTGLGLPTVRRLVADFEGEIVVESMPGRGSTFTVKLPAAS